jgi:hypothetical protein
MGKQVIYNHSSGIAKQQTTAKTYIPGLTQEAETLGNC